MDTFTSETESLVFAFAAAWNRIEKQMDSSLGAIRGISLAEYRLLRALADTPSAWASRVELAHSVGLTPSGVTRALRPLEKLGLISTAKSKRDARLTLASLTPAGQELANDASTVVTEQMQVMLDRAPDLRAKMEGLVEILDRLGR